MVPAGPIMPLAFGIAGRVAYALTGAGSPTTGAAPSASNRKLSKAAGEFESMLLESLWKSMKDTFTDQDDGTDPISEGFNDLGMQSMSQAVGQAGGLGIKNMIIKSLEPSLGASPGAARSI